MRDKRVLIVDDERRMADSLRELLAAAGYDAHAVYDGAEAIERIEREPFHVVVTDLRMWGVDGLTIIRHIRRRRPRALVIVITGHATTESAIEALRCQVFDYLRKPFDFDLFRMAIEKAFQKIETDQLREDTAAMITHDIKIPLTSIIGFAAMLYDRERGDFHPRAREFSETILVNGQKILHLIENYLTSCKIDAGTLRPMIGSVDAVRVVREVVESAELEAARRGHRIDCTLPDALPIQADEALLYRAVSNVVHNAVKYGLPEEPIRVRAEPLPAESSPLSVPAVRIEVVNRAEGLRSDDLQDIFQRYRRLHDRTRIEGSGIGLYVVRAIAAAHGGRAEAALPDAEHVRFALILPVHASVHEPPE